MGETYMGEVKNGVVFDAGMPLPPEGMKVSVAPAAAADRPATLAERYSSILGIAEDLPADMAMEHDHYVHGTPRRSEG